MPGAYNAREPADPVDPGYPPGWPSYPWPFPGPYPPGYTPTLSLVMTATDAIAYDGIASVTGSARDQDTYATNEPSAIRWSATIDGAPVNLRFSGDEDYSSSRSSDVVFGTYWGATPSVEFELTEDNEDDVVTLRGVYQLDGLWVEQTENITIALPVITAKLELSWVQSGITDPNDWTWDLEGNIKRQSPISTRVRFSQRVGDPGELLFQNITQRTDESTVTYGTYPDTEVTLDMIDFIYDEVYTVLVGVSLHDNVTLTLSATFTTYADGEEYEVYIKEVTTSYEAWLTIDAVTGEVTVINP